MDRLEQILAKKTKPALLLGNGINQFNNSKNSSWQKLLNDLAKSCNVDLTTKELEEMSNTEFFDILDLAKPASNKSNLQRDFCNDMDHWKPAAHHKKIVNWARRHNSPIITVNFDENLSKSVQADFFRGKNGFTHYYPWTSYFSDKEIISPRSSFAIWHAHGMKRYFTSIRLGLTHYMGSVQRARSSIYTKNGLRAYAKNNGDSWSGEKTWLDVFFLSPLVILGFGFKKDETFFRWLFLERARLYKVEPRLKQSTWFIDTGSINKQHRVAFLEKLGMQYISMTNHSAIYESKGWEK